MHMRFSDGVCTDFRKDKRGDFFIKYIKRTKGEICLKEKLVIEGNAVYKIDPECLLKKARERQNEEKNKKGLQKEKTNRQEKRSIENRRSR